MTKLSTLGFIKNGEKYKVLAQMPATYPASRVMLENGESVEDVTEHAIDFETQSNFTINQNASWCNSTGHISSVFIDATCVTPESTHPGVLIAKGLPVPKNRVIATVASRNDNAKSARVLIDDTTGNLYIRYGNIGSSYDVYVYYIS